MIRVLLVDDQPLLRTGFRMILDSEGDISVVGEAGDGAKAVDEIRALQPDVVLMDVRMPRMDGIEATRRIAAAAGWPSTYSPGPRVLILTTFDLDEYVVEGLRAGASGFLLKDAPPQELVNVAPSVTRRLLDRFASRLPAADAPTPNALRDLTAREIDVLRLVARGLSNAEIADELVVSETTVKTHVGHLLTKLRLRDRVQAAVFAYESGLVTPGTL
jgi:DNA-binding NarL/FixJ family response regulator